MNASEVRKALRVAFLARLEPSGWELLAVDDHSHRLAAFRRPIAEEFAATAEVWRASSVPDRPPVLVTHVLIGVSYEPLRRLAPLLDEYQLAVLCDHAWPDVGDEDEETEETEPLRVTNAQDAGHAADRLSALILERALPFAERHASLEALLAEFSSDEEGVAHTPYVALLAAAGRFDEAREALARLPARDRKEANRGDRRTLRQLQRWIDSGGDPSLIPASPPPSRRRAPPPTSVTELISDSRAESRAQSAALKEVKEQASGRSREEARAMLRDALVRHGARKQSPLWMESRLDHLWDSPEEKAHLAVNMLKGAARFSLGVARAIRDRDLPDLSPPDWLDPPDQALYEVPRGDEWIAAELDPAAREWLDRAYSSTRHVFGIVMLTAWLSPDGTSTALDVHIGEHRVGRVPTEDAAAYADVVADAARRDECPCFEAHLVRRGERYLVEVAKPPTG